MSADREPFALTVVREQPLLIGVDGGATEIKAHEVIEVEDGLGTGPATASFRCASPAAFVPIDLALQLDEHARGAVAVTSNERAESEHVISAAAHAILSVAAHARRSRVLVGMCMPGLKTKDGRGIVVMKNGPRAVDFVDRLESQLAREGLVLAAPLVRLLSDGDACGLGEETSPNGGFRGVTDAYFIGGGTGLAECFKVENRITPLDELAWSVRKGWQMKAAAGCTFEDQLSMRGIAARFRASVEHASGDERYVEDAALAGDRAAIGALRAAAEALAELIATRAHAWRSHSKNDLARVVVGQQLGALIARLELCRFLAEPAEVELARRSVQRVRIVPSLLREAPAIGAASVALESWRASERERG